MEIRINKTFLKEMAKLPQNQRTKVEDFLFNELETYNNFHKIPGIQKLKGYNNYYRIRFGTYRAGIRVEGNMIYFERLLHRKDIYKFYP
jgi:mRNA interferase RelE/StbE